MVGSQGERVCTSGYFGWVGSTRLVECSGKNVRHLLACPVRGIYPREKYNRRKPGRLDETKKARDEFILATLGQNLSDNSGNRFSGSRITLSTGDLC